MTSFKKFYAWEKKQMKNPETVLAVWMAFGVLFGVGIDNVGAGIAIGVAIGVAMYTKAKKSLEDSKNDEELLEERLEIYEKTYGLINESKPVFYDFKRNNESEPT